jgi:uncharacterized membrane protein YtjA (UPF0391 family)
LPRGGFDFSHGRRFPPYGKQWHILRATELRRTPPTWRFRSPFYRILVGKCSERKSLRRHGLSQDIPAKAAFGTAVASFSDNAASASTRPAARLIRKELAMLRWALLFLVLALIAAVLGFGGIAASFEVIGKVLFFLFLILFLVSMITGSFRPSPT